MKYLLLLNQKHKIIKFFSIYVPIWYALHIILLYLRKFDFYESFQYCSHSFRGSSNLKKAILFCNVSETDSLILLQY